MTRKLLFTALLLGSWMQAQAQLVTLLPDDPVAFLPAFVSQMNKAGQGALAKDASGAINSIWFGLSDEERTDFVGQVNAMLSKRYLINRAPADYALTFAAIKDAQSFAKISVNSFFDVTGTCIGALEERKLQAYLANLRQYVKSGFMNRNARFYWRAYQPDPVLLFISLKEKNTTYQAPVLRFVNAELKYKSDVDSTSIYNTSGDYNLVSMAFLGAGGTVNWDKVKLPPTAVFAELKSYQANFNYGKIESDSALFYFKDLLAKPLKGRYEDLNLGYKNLKTANYPAFKSYEGNVVIENLVPNVRYEGGFSLRGVRRIGSAFDKFVDYQPKPGADDTFYDDLYGTPTKADDAIEDIYDEFGISTLSEAENVGDDYYDDYYDDYGDTDDTYFEEGETGSIPEHADPYSIANVNKVLKHIPAKLEIRRGERYVMKLEGEEVVLDMENLVGKSLAATVYVTPEDSIFHPSMDLIYNVATQDVILKKPRGSQLGRLPFTSSYHNFYLYFESLQWNLKRDKMNFTAFIDQENKLAAIESFDFFSQERFNQFRGVLKFNPIGAIYRYATIFPGKDIFPEDIVNEMKMPGEKAALIAMLPQMEGSGFLRYDRKTLQIFLRDKLMDWAMFAREKKDYDVLQLTSKVDSGAYAVLNVDDRMMELRGCPVFALSDSQYVRAVPVGQQVRIGADRSMTFNGAVAAGKLNFYGNTNPNAFQFDYESFKLSCNQLDSMRFVLVRNPPAGYQMSPLEKALSRTLFEKVTGAIHIDGPTNKSGLKPLTHFPVFDSYTSAYVYWDRKSVQDGVYVRDKLYFSVDPFVLDSLDNFDEKNLLFDGEFYSSEIFPKFRQTLAVMPDFTLGFEEHTPANGYYVYNNKGLYFNDIIMDGMGLRGRGELECLSIDVRVQSDNFIFHFDSVMADIQDFHRDRGFRSGSYYPQVDASTARYVWYTKEDRLTLQSTGVPIKIFGGEADFEGKLTIRPDGMIGDGVLTLGQVRIEGDSILFKEMEFAAPGSNFVIIDKANPNLLHFVAKNVNVFYDVYEHASGFESRLGGQSTASFPIHRYHTSLAKGSYDREENTVKLEGLSAYIRDNYFMSTAPEQDSLKFNAKTSVYHIDERSIEVFGVPYIYVADATITPDKMEVIIEQSGLIRRLENAIVEADQKTKLHKIYDASVDIYSAHEYKGGGKYDYIKVKGREQFISFNNIDVNSKGTTTASGPISEAQRFYLTERILFRGKAALDASRKFLEFEGEVRIESDNPAFKGTWFPFPRTIVNPDSVFIPIREGMRNARGEFLAIGLEWQADVRNYYSLFLEPVREQTDRTVISASGGLTFDRRTKEFRIGSQSKLTGQSYKGTTVSFNDSLNTITSHGLLKFPSDFPKNAANLKFSGDWKEDLRLRQLSTDLVLSLALGEIIPKEPLKKISDNFIFLSSTNSDVDYNQRRLIENLAELIDEGKPDDKDTRKFVGEVKNVLVNTDIKVGKTLPATLLLSHVNFNYSREFKALYCDTEVGLLSVNGESVNKMIPAKIVYQYGAAAADVKVPDRLDILLEVDEFNWIYFSIIGEVVNVTSSYYDDFNNPLEAEIAKRKKTDGFRYEMSNSDEVAQFRQDFIKKYIIR